MILYIGIEGGGTTTRVFIQHEGEEPKYFEFPISLKVRNGDFASPAEKLRKIIMQASIGFTPSQTYVRAAIAIGLSGMSREEDQALLRKAIVDIPEFSDASLHIESDATLTLKSVLAEGEEGILLIAGTGSVVFYQPSGGPARRIGGWGPLLSDDGSGYRLGLLALRHYVNMLDGVFPRDALCDRMDVRMNDRKEEEEIPITQRSLTERAERDPAFVASFARDILEAMMSDPNASSRRHVRDLVYEELIELTLLIFPLMTPGVMSGHKPYNLYLAGGVGRQPVTGMVLQESYEDEDDDYFTIHLVDERAPAFKALDIARAL